MCEIMRSLLQIQRWWLFVAQKLIKNNSASSWWTFTNSIQWYLMNVILHNLRLLCIVPDCHSNFIRRCRFFFREFQHENYAKNIDFRRKYILYAVTVFFPIFYTTHNISSTYLDSWLRTGSPIIQFTSICNM